MAFVTTSFADSYPAPLMSFDSEIQRRIPLQNRASASIMIQSTLLATGLFVVSAVGHVVLVGIGAVALTIEGGIIVGSLLPNRVGTIFRNIFFPHEEAP